MIADNVRGIVRSSIPAESGYKCLLAQKPIDRWLQLVSMVFGIIFSLLPKTPPVIVGGLLLIFLLAIHPLWNFWGIENYRGRQIFAIALLAIICVLIGYNVWPVSSGRTPAPIETKVDNIEKIVKGLGEKNTREALLKKYPLGYVIFDVDYANSVFPYDSQLPSEYKLDWKVVRFTSITRDRYELSLPDIYTKENQPVMTGIKTSGLKQVNGGQGGASVGGTDIMMWSQILAVTDKGIVFLIGFEHVPGLNSSK